MGQGRSMRPFSMICLGFAPRLVFDDIEFPFESEHPLVVGKRSRGFVYLHSHIMLNGRIDRPWPISGYLHTLRTHTHKLRGTCLQVGEQGHPICIGFQFEFESGLWHEVDMCRPSRRGTVEYPQWPI